MAKRDGIYPVKDKDGKTIKDKWRVTATLTHPETGERVPKTKIVNGKKSEAKRVKADMLANPAKYLCPEKLEVMTLEAYRREWLESLRKQSMRTGKPSKTRVRDLEKYLDAWCAHIGKMRLVNISPRTVRKTLETIADEKERALGRPINSKTLNKYFLALNQCLKAAYYDGLIPANPCDRVQTPSASGESNARALEPCEFDGLMDAIEKSKRDAYGAFWEKEERLKACGHANKSREGLKGVTDVNRPIAIEIVANHGLRRGDVLGLRWQDIDLEAGTVFVRNALKWEDGKLTLGKTKTGNKVMKDIEPDTLETLKEYHAFQTECMRLLGFIQDGEEMPGETFVICNERLECNDPNKFSDWLAGWRKETDGVPNDLTLQMLRTTYVTYCAEEMAPADCAKAARHSSPTTTMKYYVKPLHENDRKAAEIMHRHRKRKRPEMQVFERKTG